MAKNVSIKKATSVFTVIMLSICMLLAACSNSNNKNAGSSSSTSASSSAQASQPTEALEPVELVWYFPGSWPQPDQEKVFAEVNKVIKEKINATVDFKALSFGEYEQKMKVVIASGENYDLAFTSNWLNNYNQNVGKGAFLPLDDLLVKYAPQSYANIPQKIWDAAKVKGQIYGFLNYQIMARTPSIMVETALAEKYNLDVNAISGKLTTHNLNLLEPFIQAVRADHPDRVFAAQLGGIESMMDFESIIGISIPGAVLYDDDTLTVINQFESDDMLSFAATMREWNQKGYLNASERITTKTDDDANDPNGSRWALRIAGAYKPGGQFSGSVPHTELPAGDAYLTTGTITATMHAINRNSKNPERAMMLLELLNTDQELNNLLNFGVKGEHFDLDAEGFMIPGPNQQSYNPFVPWMFATNFLAYVSQGTPATVWEDTKKLNEEGIPSKLLGFAFDAEPVKGEIGQTSTIYEEYYRSIELGVATEAQYNEFLAKLKAAGSDKIIAEMQKQVDAWKATK